MLNRQLSSLETETNGAATRPFSQQFAYHRSISTPGPGSSLPKSIPLPRTNRSKSVFAQNSQFDCSLPPSSAPVTFNRYINVASNNCSQVQATAAAGTSPSSSWYSRLSNSLKKSVLRRSTSAREGSQKRLLGQRRSVIKHLLLDYNLFRGGSTKTF